MLNVLADFDASASRSDGPRDRRGLPVSRVPLCRRQNARQRCSVERHTFDGAGDVGALARSTRSVIAATSTAAA